MKKMEVKKDEKIVKEDLQKSADSYKKQLEIEVNESLDQIQRIVKIAIVIAGGAFVGYSVYKTIFDNEEKEIKKKNKKTKTKTNSSSSLSLIFAPLIQAGSAVAAEFLLALAKKKLQEYIDNLDETDSTINGNSAGNH